MDTEADDADAGADADADADTAGAPGFPGEAAKRRSGEIADGAEAQVDGGLG